MVVFAMYVVDSLLKILTVMCQVSGNSTVAFNHSLTQSTVWLFGASNISKLRPIFLLGFENCNMCCSE